MKRNTSSRARAVLAALLLTPFAASAQYSIDWYKISGGGGASTGGVYSVTGTIGQADAGSMSGGNYTIDGGFWSVIQLVQSEGAPPLSIAYPTPGNVSVSWTNTPGWRLEETQTLSGSPPPWSPVGLSNLQTNSGVVSLTMTAPPGNRFYRLHKQ